MLDEATARARINEVIDPCSASVGVPIGLVDMGMLREVTIRRDGTEVAVEVRLRLTSPGCMFFPEFDAQIRERLVAEGATAVRLVFDSDYDWTPAEISPTAAAKLDRRRRRSASGSAVPLQLLSGVVTAP